MDPLFACGVCEFLFRIGWVTVSQVSPCYDGVMMTLALLWCGGCGGGWTCIIDFLYCLLFVWAAWTMGVPPFRTEYCVTSESQIGVSCNYPPEKFEFRISQ